MRILAINVAVPEHSDAKGIGLTGINKQPVGHKVLVRAPGPKANGVLSGVAGDQIFDVANHGGDDQAVYAYAREDYDWWESQLGRSLPGGIFGENFTTEGVPVSDAVVGETWRVGDDLVIQATSPRIPCATFQAKMAEPQWTKRFARENRPGAYFRVVEPGEVQAGDRVEVIARPAHGFTIADSFHAWMFEPETLRRLLDADEVPEGMKGDIRRRLRL